MLMGKKEMTIKSCKKDTNSCLPQKWIIAKLTLIECFKLNIEWVLRPNIYYLFTIFWVNCAKFFSVIIHLILTIVWSRYNESHFTDKETEAEKD